MENESDFWPICDKCGQSHPPEFSSFVYGQIVCFLCFGKPDVQNWLKEQSILNKEKISKEIEARRYA